MDIASIFVCIVEAYLLQLTVANYCFTVMGGRNVTFCCNNSEKRGNICEDCSIGFVSVDGEPCKACPEGRYGRKCISICTCKVNERCNHVHGCLKLNHLTSTERARISSVKSVSSQLTSLMSILFNEKMSTHNEGTSRRSTDTDTGITTMMYASKMTAVNDNKSSNGENILMKELLRREIIIYSISILSIIIVLSLSLGFFCYKMKMIGCCKECRGIFKRDVRRSVEINVLENPYDLINEENMLKSDTLVENLHGKESSKKLSQRSCEFIKSSIESDGYLKPCSSGKQEYLSDASSENNSSICHSLVEVKDPNMDNNHSYQSIEDNYVRPHDYTECNTVQYLELYDRNTGLFEKQNKHLSKVIKQLEMNAGILNISDKLKTKKEQRQYVSEMNIFNYKGRIDNISKIRTSF